MQSVRSSNLINADTVTRALRDILQGLADRGLLVSFRTTLETQGNPRLVHEFPAFNMLATARKFTPYKWFLPKPRVSISEFLRIYEQFAVAVRGGTENPAEVASKIYSRQSHTGRLLTHFSHESQWLAAGHTLLASAMWLGAELEANDGGLVRMRLGTGLLEVSSDGVWSNTERKVLAPPGQRQVFGRWHPARPALGMWPVAPFPATTSDNPILHAFWALRESVDPALIFAASVVAIALKEEVVNRAFLRTEVDRLSRKMLASSRTTPRGLESATASLQQCVEVLEEAQEGVVQALYEAAVPGLMSASRFRSMFGVPSQADPDRVVHPSTRAKWTQKLEQVYEDLHSAIV